MQKQRKFGEFGVFFWQFNGYSFVSVYGCVCSGNPASRQKRYQTNCDCEQGFCEMVNDGVTNAYDLNLNNISSTVGQLSAHIKMQTK